MLAKFRLVAKGIDLGDKVHFSPCDSLDLTMNVTNDEESLAQLGKLIGVEWSTASKLDKLLLRSVTYKYLMIAVIVQSSEARQVVGYRLYDMRFDTVADFTLDSVRARVFEGSVVVQNLEVDVSGNLYCSHGKLDDYPMIDISGNLLTKAKCIPLGLPPLNNVFPCVDYRGNLTMVTTGDVSVQSRVGMVRNKGVAPKQSGVDTCVLGTDWVVEPNDTGELCVVLGERLKRPDINDRVELFSPDVLQETSVWFNGAMKGSEEAERSAATLPIHHLASEGFLYTGEAGSLISDAMPYKTYYSPLDALHLFKYNSISTEINPDTGKKRIMCSSLSSHEWVLELKTGFTHDSAVHYLRPIVKEFLNIRNLCHYNWHRMIEPNLGASRGIVTRAGSTEYGILDGMHIYAMLFNMLLLAPFCGSDFDDSRGWLNELMDCVDVLKRDRREPDWYRLIYQSTQSLYTPMTIASLISDWLNFGSKQSNRVYFQSAMKFFNDLRGVLLSIAKEQGISEEELYLPVLPLCIVRYIREQELQQAVIRSSNSDELEGITSDFEGIWYGNFWKANNYDTPLELDAPLAFVSRVVKSQSDMLIREANALRFSASPSQGRVLNSVVINPLAIRSVSIGEFPMANKLIIGDNVTEFYTVPLKRDTTVRTSYSSSCWREFESGTSLTEIMGSLFEDCRALEKVTIRSSEKIGSRAFANCISLKQLTLPGNLKVIGSKSFAYCTSLRTLVLPEGIEVIEDEAFLLCTGLERVIFPASLREIGKRAFQSCDSLMSVQFNGIPKIHSTAFEGCMSSVLASIPKSRKGKKG